MPKPSGFIEVWGDTVDIGELARAIIIGGALALTAFIAARAVLRQMVADAAIASSYAMLVGLGGCVLAGIVCAKLYKPKRQIIDGEADPTWRETAMRELANDAQGMGKLSELPPNVIAELKEIGLYETFVRHEQQPVDATPAIQPEPGAPARPAAPTSA